MGLNKDFKVKNSLCVSESLNVTQSACVGGDTSIYGNLSVYGDETVLRTIISTTSALSVINHGTGPALYVRQAGSNEPIAEFVDKEGGQIIFDDSGFVGIGTTNPTQKLTVAGGISAIGLSAMTANQGIVSAGRDLSDIFVTTAAAGSICGSGTTNLIPKWSGSTTLTDSILRESAGQITVAGGLSAVGLSALALNSGILSGGKDLNTLFNNCAGTVTTAGALLSGSTTTIGVNSGALDYLNQSACPGINCEGTVTSVGGGDGLTGTVTSSGTLTVDSSVARRNSANTFTGGLSAVGLSALATNNGIVSAGRDLADIFTTCAGDVTGVTACAGLSGGGTDGDICIGLNATTANSLNQAGCPGINCEGTTTPSNCQTFTNKSGNISQWTNDCCYTDCTGTTTASNCQTFTNKSGCISQWTNDSGYLTCACDGTVTCVGTGDGLCGGAITSSGTLTVDSTVARRNALNNFTGGLSAVGLSALATNQGFVSAGRDLADIFATSSGNVDGSGTANYLPVWSDTDTIGNSIACQSTGLLTVAGSISSQGYCSDVNSNTKIGTDALDANTTGDQNTALGHCALNDNTTGGCNVAIGHLSLKLNISGDGAVAIGYGAGCKHNYDRKNTYVGYEAGRFTTYAAAATFIGECAGFRNTTGGANTAIGNRALEGNTVGQSNVSIGTNSGPGSTGDGGDESVFIASAAGYCNDASYQVMVGGNAGRYQKTGPNITAVGYNANRGSDGNTTGYYNTSIGSCANYAITTAGCSTAVGYKASFNNTTGAQNTTVGVCALHTTTIGGENVSVGYQSLYNNITGGCLVAIGNKALCSNNCTGFSTAVGHETLMTSITGANNTAVGFRALCKVNAIANTAVGTSALRNTTAGTYNEAFGVNALFNNTTGCQNVGIGTHALYSNTANNNTAVGNNALRSNTTGTFNTGVGLYAGCNNNTGDCNIMFGYAAGRYLANGSSSLCAPENSTYIGTCTRGNTDEENNAIVIGYCACSCGSNTISFGNANITNTYLNGSLSSNGTITSEAVHVSATTNGFVSAGRDLADIFASSSGNVDGSGTANYLPVWSDTDTIGNSIACQSSTQLTVGGNISATGYLSAGLGINVPDSSKITLGDAQDLQIYHSGSQSYIQDKGTGGLYLQTNGPAIYLQDTDGNAMAQFSDNGGSFLMYNHALKLGTTNTGACIYGGLSAASLSAAGVNQGFVSAGRDLSDIFSGCTGTIDGSGTTCYIANFADSNTIQSSPGYFDSEELRIKSLSAAAGLCTAGIRSVGDNLTVAGSISTVGYLSAGSGINVPDSSKITAGSAHDLQIYHDGSNSYINETGTGDLYICGGNDIIFKDAVGNLLANMNQSNSVELYYGGSKKLETASGGVDVTGMLCTTDNIRAENSSFMGGREDASAPTYRFHDDGDTGMFNVASDILAFSTGGTEQMRILSSGFVGIKTTTPAATLHVAGSAYIEDSTTIMGNLSVHGDLIYIDTSVTVTSALSVINAGTGPALYVEQAGAGEPIAKFIDREGGEIHFADTGEVGIGTADPDYKLEVNSNTADNGIRITSNNTARHAIDLWTESGTNGGGDIRLYTGVNLIDTRFRQTGSFVHATCTGSNFGVGTCTPNEKLTVAGNISANGGITGESVTSPDICGTTSVCAPAICGTTSVISPVISGTTSVCGVAVCGTTSVTSPAICGTTSVCGGIISDGSSCLDGSGNICAMYMVEGACICGTTSVISPVISGTTVCASGDISAQGSLSAAGPNNNYFAGCVGIGTNSPATDLHIKSASPVIRLEDSAPDGVYGSIDGAGGSMILDADRGDGYDGSNIQFRIDNQDKMRILSGGNVGIGTIAPARKLDVVGDAQVSTNLVVGTALYTNDWTASTSGIQYIKNSSGSTSIAIENGGNVGIGTAAPNEKLTVSGNISANGAITAETMHVSSATNGFISAGRDLADIFATSSGNVDGSGTANVLPVWSDTDTLTDSIARQSTGQLTVAGNLTATGYLSAAAGISVPDSSKITLGNAHDLQLFHDGSASNIAADGTGNLYITQCTADADIRFQADDSTGSPTTYFFLDGSGVNTCVQKNFRFADSVKAGFGSSENFKICHTGSLGILTNNTGHLYLQNSADNSDIYIQSDDGYGSTVNYIVADGGNEQVYISTGLPASAGEVGIGTSSPDQKLTVAGNLKLTSTYPRIFLQDTNNDSDFSIINNDGNFGIYDDTNAEYRAQIIAGGNFGIGTTAPAEKLTVAGNISAQGSLSAAGTSPNYFAGNVGIGTTTPAANLHVAGDINIEDGYYLKYNNSTNLSILGSSSTGTTYTSLNHHFKAYDGSVSYSEYMTIDTGGKVGIGETSPNEKLTVAGNISAQGDVCIGDDLIVNGESITVCGAAAMLNFCDTTDTDDMYMTFANAGTCYARVGFVNATDFDICTNNRDIGLLPGTHNVGIGETAPGEKLTVAGNISASGNGYFACVIAGGYFEEKAASAALAEYPTGSLVVIGCGGNLELSTKSNDKNVFGVTQNGVCQPIVLGAEPVLVTGDINIGDFITTSDKAGHGKRTLNTIHGTVIAQAMEAGCGCSYTLQAMIRKM